MEFSERMSKRFVVDANGFVNSGRNLSPIFKSSGANQQRTCSCCSRRRAAPQIPYLGRIADEAGIKLDGILHERPHIRYEVIGNTSTAQEDLWDICVGPIDRVNADGRRP